MFLLVLGIRAAPPGNFFPIIIPVKGVIRDFRVQFKAIKATQINVSCRVAEEAGSATFHLVLSSFDATVCVVATYKQQIMFHDEKNCMFNLLPGCSQA